MLKQSRLTNSKGDVTGKLDWYLTGVSHDKLEYFFSRDLTLSHIAQHFAFKYTTSFNSLLVHDHLEEFSRGFPMVIILCFAVRFVRCV